MIQNVTNGVGRTSAYGATVKGGYFQIENHNATSSKTSAAIFRNIL